MDLTRCRTPMGFFVQTSTVPPCLHKAYIKWKLFYAQQLNPDQKSCWVGRQLYCHFFLWIGDECNFFTIRIPWYVAYLLPCQMSDLGVRELRSWWGDIFVNWEQGVSEAILQSAIDFACGVGNANCSEIQSNATCYLPNTRYSHASYAMNQYYVTSNTGSVACNFQGAAQITVTDPSKWNTVKFQCLIFLWFLFKHFVMLACWYVSVCPSGNSLHHPGIQCLPSFRVWRIRRKVYSLCQFEGVVVLELGKFTGMYF